MTSTTLLCPATIKYDKNTTCTNDLFYTPMSCLNKVIRTQGGSWVAQLDTVRPAAADATLKENTDLGPATTVCPGSSDPT